MKNKLFNMYDTTNFDEIFTELFDIFGYEYEIGGNDYSSLIKPNIYREDNNTIIEYPLIGIDKENVTINLDDDILKISVNKEEKDEKEYIKKGFHIFNKLDKKLKIIKIERMEIENITSKMNNGILTITIPNKKEFSKSINID